MPRYYFHLDGDRDELGFDLADLAAAKCEAVKYAGRQICDDARTFWERAEWTLTVADGTGLTLFQLHIVGVESAAVRAPSPCGVKAV